MSRSIITFGEIMMRLSTPGNLRLRQAHSFDIVYGGAEANVAVALANIGRPVQFITRLPENELGIACLQSLRQHAVGTDFIAFGGDRLGLYFLEVGAGHRPSQVIYDRANSSFSAIDQSMFRWDEAFAGASWFHWSGISPAVSASAAQTTAHAVAAAREAGLTISCDLNYRHTLWQWGQPPSEYMPELIKQCDILSANTAHLMLGLQDLPVGRTPTEAAEACTLLSRHFPNLKQIAMTCKEGETSGVQWLTGVFWQAGRVYTSLSFTITNVVDRIGAGDAFMAGLIYGRTSFPDDPQHVVDFAAASAAVKHSIVGDANLAAVDEIEGLLGSGAGFDIIR